MLPQESHLPRPQIDAAPGGEPGPYAGKLQEQHAREGSDDSWAVGRSDDSWTCQGDSPGEAMTGQGMTLPQGEQPPRYEGPRGQEELFAQQAHEPRERPLWLQQVATGKRKLPLLDAAHEGSVRHIVATRQAALVEQLRHDLRANGMEPLPFLAGQSALDEAACVSHHAMIIRRRQPHADERSRRVMEALLQA